MPANLLVSIPMRWRIVTKRCPSEAAATHREAALIAALNPRFNRPGSTWPTRRGVSWSPPKTNPTGKPGSAALCVQGD